MTELMSVDECSHHIVTVYSSKIISAYMWILANIRSAREDFDIFTIFHNMDGTVEFKLKCTTSQITEFKLRFG